MEQKKEPFSVAAETGCPVIKTPAGYRIIEKLPDGSQSEIPVQSTYLGVAVTDDLLQQLKDKGKTQQLLFSQLGGQHNLGRLTTHNGIVSVEMDKLYLNAVCPVCIGRIIHTSKGYCCENHHPGDPHSCPWHMPGVLGNRLILPFEVEDMLNGHPEILDGFRSNANDPYSGYLVLNGQHTVSVNACVGHCPRCGGRMLVGPNGFRCENYNNPDHPCKTRFYRFYGGNRLRLRHWQQLEKYGHTTDDLTGIREDGSLYPMILRFNEDRTLIQKFERI